MPVVFQNRKFHLYNGSMSYVIEISRDNDLLNVYFGKYVDSDEINTVYPGNRSWQCYKSMEGGCYQLGLLPCEYPTAASPDFRAPAFEAEVPSGVNTFQFKYKDYEIISGKPALEGLPAVYAESGDSVQTLKIITADEYAGIEIDLFYTVFDRFNAVCRHSEIKNIGKDGIKIKNAQSVSLDFPNGAYEYIHFPGDWAREKHISRAAVTVGTQGFETRCGASSHAENPFMIFGDRGMNENYGNVYGISLIYSGNHSFKIECISDILPRVQAGINPFMFSYCLAPGETFVTPEAVITYSANGIGEMSRTFHRLYRTRLCRGKYRDLPRPVLVNNWEGTYFNFDRKRLLDIADEAAKIGIELFVLDDGWFGRRNDDRSSLGDWFANEEKLGGSLGSLAEEINRRGLKFGLWFEPEMISEDSALYRAHPDWAVSVPGKKPLLSRSQLVLDYTKPQVRDYIVKTVSDVLSGANIEYVKWDKNRMISEPYSDSLPPERQGEFYHRYILGVYDVLERITSAFPDVLFESCSGGGGRNDPGMLYYMPQTWISDDTDAVERLYIQYGSSFVYPMSSVGAHVSAVPNHQTGRITSLSMRGTVAMNGAFGYELDLAKVSGDEKETMRAQVSFYKKNRGIVNDGDYYRLLSPYETDYSAWMYVSGDQSRALLYFAAAALTPNPIPIRIKLQGLDGDRLYTVNHETYTGRTLMNYGVYVAVNPWNNNFIYEIEGL